MNRKFYDFIVLASILLLAAAVSNSHAKKTAPAKNDVPQIKFDNLVYDFGEIVPESMNNCTFKFTNTGKETLQIQETKGTCKCTVPALEKKEYAPGESGQITVQFHAPAYTGPTSQHVFVLTNDTNNPRTELTIKANVQSKVRVNPEVMNLSLVDANNAGATPITIKSIDGQPFAIKSIISEGNVFTIDYDPNKMADTHILYPKINMESLRRYLNGAIVFEINHPSGKNVRVSYNSLKEFEASPGVVIIRDAAPGKPQERTIYLTSNYNQPVDIESVNSEKGIVKVISQKRTENRFEFVVEITPPQKEGSLRVFSDTLHIKIKGKDPIDVPCRGFYKLGRLG